MSKKATSLQNKPFKIRSYYNGNNFQNQNCKLVTNKFKNEHDTSLSLTYIIAKRVLFRKFQIVMQIK